MNHIRQRVSILGSTPRGSMFGGALVGFLLALCSSTAVPAEVAAERAKLMDRIARSVFDPRVPPEELGKHIQEAIQVDLPQHGHGKDRMAGPPAGSTPWPVKYGYPAGRDRTFWVDVPDHALRVGVMLRTAVNQVWIEFQRNGQPAGQVILDAFHGSKHLARGVLFCVRDDNYLLIEQVVKDVRYDRNSFWLAEHPSLRLVLYGPAYGGTQLGGTEHGVIREGVSYTRVQLNGISFLLAVRPDAQGDPVVSGAEETLKGIAAGLAETARDEETVKQLLGQWTRTQRFPRGDWVHTLSFKADGAFMNDIVRPGLSMFNARGTYRVHNGVLTIKVEPGPGSPGYTENWQVDSVSDREFSYRIMGILDDRPALSSVITLQRKQ